MREEKKQGFTLIELLAVIVILAVIALIATPLIMGTITKAKKNAFKDTAYGILKAGEKYTAELLLENENTYTGETIQIPELGTNKKLEYKGQEPKGGQMFITSDGDISLVIYNDSFCAIKNANDKEVNIDKYHKDNCKLVVPTTGNASAMIQLKNVVDNQEGLFQDDYGNTRYRGSNTEVKNYVTFNNEIWRIIGVFDGRVKMIRNESIGSWQWNSTTTSNNWNNTPLSAHLKGNYYNGLSVNAKNQIESNTFYLGGHDTTIGISAKTMYLKERGTVVYPGNSVSTNQIVGLMYPSDYGYAARKSCNKDLRYYNEDANCSTAGNWLYTSGVTQWLITTRSDVTSNSFFISSSGFVGYGYNLTDAYMIRPVVYLKSNIKITGGNGTTNSPYTIE